MISSLQLDITRKCQQQCGHCYNASGPEGNHGTMTVGDWEDVIAQAEVAKINRIQFIGGEPTLNPALGRLMSCAVDRDINVEVFTNMVYVPGWLWQLAAERGEMVSMATSWYSADLDVHAEITKRRTQRQIIGNIARAAAAGIALRVGVIDLGREAGQDVDAARKVLVSLGVAADHVSIDRVRRIGRASKDGRGDESQLCGRCGTATAAVLPDGSVAPCPMAWWLSVGDVRNDSLSALIGERLPQLVRVRTAPRCAPSCGPNCNPMSGCVPWSACRPNG